MILHTVPYSENAVVDLKKLRDYCLCPSHSEGKHKARVFLSKVGMSTSDAEALRRILLKVVRSHVAQIGYGDAYGQRYQVDFILQWQQKPVPVRSAWILEHGSNVPRLISCYPL